MTVVSTSNTIMQKCQPLHQTSSGYSSNYSGKSQHGGSSEHRPVQNQTSTSSGVSSQHDTDTLFHYEDLSQCSFREFFFHAVPLVVHPIIILRVLCHKVFGNMLRRKQPISHISSLRLSPPPTHHDLADTCPPRSSIGAETAEQTKVTQAESSAHPKKKHVQISTPIEEAEDEQLRMERKRKQRAGSMDKYLARWNSRRKISGQTGNALMTMAIKSIGESLIQPLDLNINSSPKLNDLDFGSDHLAECEKGRSVFRFPSLKNKNKGSKSYGHLASLGESLDGYGLESSKSSAQSLNKQGSAVIKELEKELINLPIFEVDTHRMDQATSPLLSRSNSVPDFDHIDTAQMLPSNANVLGQIYTSSLKDRPKAKKNVPKSKQYESVALSNDQRTNKQNKVVDGSKFANHMGKCPETNMDEICFDNANIPLLKCTPDNYHSVCDREFSSGSQISDKQSSAIVGICKSASGQDINTGRMAEQHTNTAATSYSHEPLIRLSEPTAQHKSSQQPSVCNSFNHHSEALLQMSQSHHSKPIKNASLSSSPKEWVECVDTRQELQLKPSKPRGIDRPPPLLLTSSNLTSNNDKTQHTHSDRGRMSDPPSYNSFRSVSSSFKLKLSPSAPALNYLSYHCPETLPSRTQTVVTTVSHRDACQALVSPTQPAIEVHFAAATPCDSPALSTNSNITPTKESEPLPGHVILPKLSELRGPSASQLTEIQTRGNEHDYVIDCDGIVQMNNNNHATTVHSDVIPKKDLLSIDLEDIKKSVLLLSPTLSSPSVHSQLLSPSNTITSEHSNQAKDLHSPQSYCIAPLSPFIGNEVPVQHQGIMRIIETWVGVCPLDLETGPTMKKEMKDFLSKMASLGAVYKSWSVNIQEKLKLEVCINFT